uniref:Uncharacterized protein n=1 Tax=viral metagenome TaxID=1070528 RepID=A0A6H1ZE08_9ZZZZ
MENMKPTIDGRILRAAMEAKGYAVSHVVFEFARRGYKISDQTLYGWFRNAQEPGAALILVFAEIVDADPKTFLAGGKSGGK